MDGLGGKRMTRRASVERVLVFHLRTPLTVDLCIDRSCDNYMLLNLHTVRCDEFDIYHLKGIAACMHVFKGCISHAGQSLLSIYRIAFIISTITQ